MPERFGEGIETDFFPKLSSLLPPGSLAQVGGVSVGEAGHFGEKLGDSSDESASL